MDQKLVNVKITLEGRLDIYETLEKYEAEKFLRLIESNTSDIIRLKDRIFMRSKILCVQVTNVVKQEVKPYTGAVFSGYLVSGSISCVTVASSYNPIYACGPYIPYCGSIRS